MRKWKKYPLEEALEKFFNAARKHFFQNKNSMDKMATAMEISSVILLLAAIVFRLRG